MNEWSVMRKSRSQKLLGALSVVQPWCAFLAPELSESTTDCKRKAQPELGCFNIRGQATLWPWWWCSHGLLRLLRPCWIVAPTDRLPVTGVG